MATQSPFSFPGGIFARILDSAQPPQWLVSEVQHRVVLFLNHVLMQESIAMERLTRQSGRVVQVQWRSIQLALQITPAGLLDLAEPGATPDLRVHVVDESPLALARDVLQGEKPAIRIDGDVQFAAEIQWLVDHVRWDVEEDLARIVGDTPAHWLASFGQRIAVALRQFVNMGVRTADRFGGSRSGQQAQPPAPPTPPGYGTGTDSPSERQPS
ncbi:ubiquinone biosynthesis accessory factor UbiJ [Comamonas sp. 4034]|uniref:ubiquinone biosynthesis accessory factor UbiJ n=1 Tax=Comamonas sp. 4034 TaxID=3156455 RepID=UPI003D19BC79